MLAGLFLLIVVAVTAAGYVFVLRPSQNSSAAAQLPAGLALGQQDLPPAQAAVFDAFRLIGEAMPGSGNNTELRRQLVAAGYRWPSAVSIFTGIKAASALLWGVAAAWGAMIGRSDTGAAALALLCGGGFGYLIPDRILDRLVRRRVAQLRHALPAALDLLVLAIEAGQGLDAAILETSRGLRVSHPALASEFTQLQLELKANTTRTEALRNFAARSRDMEMRKFANLLIDTDRFGTSLGPALKTHARYLRIRFRQMAQERARKVGVKLIFPVFFLIFPSVILVTLGPAVLLLMTQMAKLMAF
ncbi:MAG TPA: type II secretion system F family protein [Bryobacteraceae bacterium]|nr:type II secretion system F family protein [Bryobacteraceae bacterium]